MTNLTEAQAAILTAVSQSILQGQLAVSHLASLLESAALAQGRTPDLEKDLEQWKGRASELEPYRLKTRIAQLESEQREAREQEEARFVEHRPKT